jgi:enolase
MSAASDPRIRLVKGRRVWDSRGRPTVEAEAHLADGSVGRAIAPAGASRGRYEAVDLRDGGDAFGGFGVARALAGIADEIAPALAGLRADNQAKIDRTLIELDGTTNKGRLGGNSTTAVSMAVAHAAAESAGMPLWRYLSHDGKARMPMPLVQVFGGGAHAGRRIDLQDVMLVPLGASTFDEATAMAAEVYRAAGRIMSEHGLLRGVADEGGWWPEFSSNEEALEQAVAAIERAGYVPGEQVALALDIAATQFRSGKKYRLGTDSTELDTSGMVERLVEWCRRFPIVSVEDPLAEDDDEGMRAFTAAVGKRVQVIGDDYLVTSATRVARAAVRNACNAVLLKPNQAGTLTETQDALNAARAAGWRAIVSARSGETEDTTIVHLAIGWGADQIKVGSFARSERMAKWNEAIRVEEQLGDNAIFAGREAIGGQEPPLPLPLP